MLHITHVNCIIVRAESNGGIFRIPQYHHQGAGGQADQGQRGVHHVGGGFVQTIIIIIYQNMYITILFAHDLVCNSAFT